LFESAFAWTAKKQKSAAAISRGHRGAGGMLGVIGNFSPKRDFSQYADGRRPRGYKLAVG